MSYTDHERRENEQVASFTLGLVGGMLLVGALYTSGYMTRIRAFKKRLLCKITDKHNLKDSDTKNGR